MVLTDHRLVGGDLHYVKAVNFTELVFLGQCGTRHTRKLAVHTEIVLEGDGCKRFVLFLYLYAFLCLNRLMQAVGIASAGHQTTCKGIYDHYTVFVDHIVHVTLHTTVCSDRLIHMMRDLGILGIGKVRKSEEGFCLFGTLGR